MDLSYRHNEILFLTELCKGNNYNISLTKYLSIDFKSVTHTAKGSLWLQSWEKSEMRFQATFFVGVQIYLQKKL